MADDTDLSQLKDKFDALTKQMTQMNKLFGKYNSGQSGSGNGSIKKAAQDLDDVSKKSTAFKTSLTILGNSASRFVANLDKGTIDVGHHVSLYGKVFESSGGLLSKGAGLIVTSLAFAADEIGKEIGDVVKQYQNLRDIGQTYGGSIVGLGQAAARSQMSLKDYAEFMKKNSNAAAVVPIAQWSASLRTSLRDVGELGMSTSELNDVVGTYANTLGLFGKMQQVSTTQATNSMRDLSIEASALAGVSGKSRMAILADATKAMDTATLRAAISEKEGAAGVAFADNMTKATMFLSSLPGQAGQFMSQMLAETVGSGHSFMSQGGQDMINAGMFGVGQMMDAMAEKVKSGKQLSPQDEADFYQDFLKEGKANMKNLQMLAAAGNESAKRAISMITDMENNASNYTAENIARQKKMATEQTDVTRNLTNFQNTMDKVSSGIRITFWDAIDKFSSSPEFQKFLDKMGEIANKVGAWFSSVFTPENLNKALNTIEVIGGGFWKAANFLIDAFNKIRDTLGNLGTAVAVAIAYFGTKKFVQNFKNAKVQANKRAEYAQQATLIGDHFAKTLQRYSQGASLRVFETNPKASSSGGGSGGNGWPEEKNRKETPEERNRRIRNKGKLGGAVQEAEEVAEEAGHSPLAKEAEEAIAKEVKPSRLKSLLGVGEKLAGHIKSLNPLGIAMSVGGGMLLDHFKDKLPGVAGQYAGSAIDKSSKYAGWGTGIGAAVGGIAGGVFGLGAGAVPGAMAGAEVGGAIGTGVGAIAGIVEKYLELHPDNKAVAPKDPKNNNNISKADATNPQNMAANLQKQNADLQKTAAAQQDVMKKILDALNKGNSQDKAIANQAQDNMKKLGMNIGPKV